eukprot:TRINITY_DN10763_c0_g2_i1.p1 TRINITY_DN10763_c0_g2~~TRINITY_DN10763_c0_g2_i1.p1  ORF type:complete len:136 (-),score=29.14 TRINITY_DN10763_c0_g2_i1:99-467(-)
MGDESQPSERKRGRKPANSESKKDNSSKPVSFVKDLPTMMYGFGDVKNPEDETVNLMQELVFEYIREMTFKASEVASKRGKIQPEDLVFVIRKDRKKYARAIELLSMNEELKRARKQFDSRI